MTIFRGAWLRSAVVLAAIVATAPVIIPALIGDAAAQTQRQRRELREQWEREQRERERDLREQWEREQRQREQQLREQWERERRQQQPAVPTPPARPGAPPAAEQPPAAQPPVPVRVVPTPKTEQELAAEREQRERWAALDNRLLILAGVLAGLGLFQVIALTVLGMFVWLALRAMGRSAQLAGRNAVLAQRAFVHVSSLAWSLAGAGGVKVSPTWENNGTTPSRSLRISTNWKAWHGELPADFAYSYTRPPDRLFLGPKGKTDVGSVTIPIRDIQAAIEERVQLYYWGRATYEDIFEGSEAHFVEFCYRLDAKGTAPNAIAVAFSHYGPHNRTDEDSQRPAILDER
jgi:hypothetical protein